MLLDETITTQTIANFQIPFLQFIDASRQATQALPEFANDSTLLELYRLMTLTRVLDTKAVNLQRTGKMGTYPSSQGQEAVGVGLGHALAPDDVFCTYYRDQGALIQRNQSMTNVLAYWGGDERGSDFQHHREDFPICVPIAGQCLHACGVGYAIKYRKQQRAVLTTIGEGGTSKGDFYEALNLAGAWQLPVVFVVNNNQWAISVPRDKQTHTQTIAQKAIAAGFSGIQVDGNDVVAVRYAVDQALQKARRGDGPTLIEAVTYRLCDHTTADDAKRYSSHEDRKKAWEKEPIARLGYFLEAQGLWDREKEAALQQRCREEVDAAVTEYINAPKPKPTDMFDHLYAQLPEALLDQRDELGESA